MIISHKMKDAVHEKFFNFLIGIDAVKLSIFPGDSRGDKNLTQKGHTVVLDHLTEVKTQYVGRIIQLPVPGIDCEYFSLADKRYGSKITMKYED